jgi:hypothetical protein
MFPQILAMKIQGGSNGSTVDIGSWPFIVGSLPFVVVTVFIIMIFWYFVSKKRLEHQQILAAIDKGTPLSELRPINKKESTWIKSFSTGIAFLLMGIGFVSIATYSTLTKKPDEDAGFGLFIASIVFLAFGAAGVVSGILKKKNQKALSSENSTFNSNQEK